MPRRAKKTYKSRYRRRKTTFKRRRIYGRRFSRKRIARRGRYTRRTPLYGGVPLLSWKHFLYTEGKTTALGHPAGGGWAYANFRANCPYDPNTALGNSGTAGWAEWGNFYQYYLVKTAKITVTFAIQPEHTGPTDPIGIQLPVWCGIIAYDKVNFDIASWQELIEAKSTYPYRVVKLMGNALGSSNKCTLSLKAKNWKLQGGTRLIYTTQGSNYGDWTARPQAEQLFTVFVATAAPNAVVPIVHITTNIEYGVKCHRNKKLTQPSSVDIPKTTGETIDDTHWELTGDIDSV